MSEINDLGRAARPAKFVSIQGIGSGTAASSEMVFGSVSGTEQRDASESQMGGSLSFGADFGNADGDIGSRITANITSAHLDDFGDTGSCCLPSSALASWQGKAIPTQRSTSTGLRRGATPQTWTCA